MVPHNREQMFSTRPEQVSCKSTITAGDTQQQTKTKRPVDTTELVVMTGGGSGIGQAATIRLAQRGATVLIVGRTEDKLVGTQQMAKEMGLKGSVEIVGADVTCQEGRDKIVEKVMQLRDEKGAVLRTIVHNAGVNTPCKPMMEISEKEWNFVNSVNVNGPLFLTQALRSLYGTTETEKNRLILLGSVARQCKGLPNYGPYAITKLTLYGLNLMLQEELPDSEHPVQVASLIPGEVDTDMQRETAYNSADAFPDHLVEYWQKIQETGQLLPPEVTGAFMEYVIFDAPPENFPEEWFIYDESHHKDWAYEFPDVDIVEPEGLK
eukprot:CAMPEP_0184491018 /NCGR_PEP_ID=MMETSP0113_2-20130426/19438_1 /TAXON_ID=91329 /ORGANISM="Norrisiella sphaerica, Strain BC52" /LENGTH=321 /DNA_ID=CAMNT_0026875189 /DNA_START=388 /DNA_END=1353 /DNA_ORIENTATION=-